MYEVVYVDYVNVVSWFNGVVQNFVNLLGVQIWLLVYLVIQVQMQVMFKGMMVNYVFVISMIYNFSLFWGGLIWNYMLIYWGNEMFFGFECWCLKSLQIGGSC